MTNKISWWRHFPISPTIKTSILVWLNEWCPSPILTQWSTSVHPESVRKPLVFWRSQGIQKWNIGLKFVNPTLYQRAPLVKISNSYNICFILRYSPPPLQSTDIIWETVLRTNIKRYACESFTCKAYLKITTVWINKRTNIVPHHKTYWNLLVQPCTVTAD